MICIKCNSKLEIIKPYNVVCKCYSESYPQIYYKNEKFMIIKLFGDVLIYKYSNKTCDFNLIYTVPEDYTLKQIESILDNLIFI
jgi:hypothetical protein